LEKDKEVWDELLHPFHNGLEYCVKDVDSNFPVCHCC
jgi:hypothetical protein